MKVKTEETKRLKTEEIVKRILIFLARKGASSKWQIANELGLAYSSVHKVINRLLKAQLIQVVNKRKSERNPKIEVEYYNISATGLINLICLNVVWDAIDEIAEAQSEFLPLIFGKWRFFKENKLRDVIVDRLWLAFYDITSHFRFKDLALRQIIVLEKAKDKDKQELEKVFESMDSFMKTVVLNEITEKVIFGYPDTTTIQEQQKFLSVLRKDPDLRRYITRTLEQKERKYVKWLEHIRFLRSWWLSTSEEELKEESKKK